MHASRALAGLAAGLLVLAAAGCATRGPASRAPGDPMARYAPPLGFSARRVHREIARFLDGRTAPNGLLPSFNRTNPYLFSNETGRFHEYFYAKMGYLDDQAFTYDLALVAIAQLLLGNPPAAEKILDVLEDDFYKPKNNRWGLYNSYLVSSRIPADDLQLGADGDRMHTGPMLWVALAALNHARLVRNTRYLEFVLDMVHWCRTELAYYKFPDGERGGISMGMGWGPNWFTIFSTEHNVDYYAVLRMLNDIWEESPDDVRRVFRAKKIDGAWLKDEMDHVGRWLREVVFDWDAYVFRAGVNENGVDPLRILDGTSWGLGGVGPETFAAWGIDLDRLLAQTEMYFFTEYRLPGGGLVRGIDFTDPEGYERQREPLVWFEGTGQLIIAYAELVRYYAARGDEARARRYGAKAVELTRDMDTFSRAYGMKSSLPYMAIRPPTNEIVKTLKWEWEIPRGRDEEQFVGSLSSTTWFLYCANDFYNPMKWGRP